MPNRSRGTPRTTNTTALGLGHDHQTNRTRLLARHVDGRRCWWCGKPMYRDRTKNHDYNPNAVRKDGKPDTTSGALAADHSKSRARYGRRAGLADRLLHGLCNKQRQDGMRDEERPALMAAGVPPPAEQAALDRIGPVVMGWPWHY